MDKNKLHDRLNEYCSKFVNQNMSPEELTIFYNDYKDYHELHLAVPYYAPNTMATAAEKYVSDKSITVLDIGAGSGLLGIELMKLGFTEIDGLEPASNFTQTLKVHGYKNIFTEGIHEGKETSLKTGSYKCVVSSGSFCNGHIPVKGLYEFARITATGGIIGILMRKSYLKAPFYLPLTETMQKMEDDGLWKLLERKENAKYYADESGYLVIYQKL